MLLPRTLRSLFKNWPFLIGISLLLPPTLLGLFGPLMIQKETTFAGSTTADMPPSSVHLLGTDSLGRDVFAVLVYSIGNSYSIGILAGVFSELIGLTVGLVGGYRGGIPDGILASFTNIFMVIPTWPLLVVLAAYVRVMTLEAICLIIAVFGWAASARRIRSQVMSLRERGFIDLARLSGLSGVEIPFREVVPNMLTFIGVLLVNRISAAIGTEVSLQIVGLGPQGFQTLGQMLYWALQRGAIIKGMWWWLVPTILCLAAIFIGLHLVNMGLETTFNPRLRR